MGDIRLKKITVEKNQSPLIIQNGNVNFKSTNESSSIITGAVIVDGGIAINTSFDSTSSTAGGSLTIGGGVGILKNTYIGKNLRLDSSTGEFRIDGLTESRFFVDSITNKNITFAPDGINKIFEINESSLNINATNSSINSTSAGLTILGGLSVNSTSNATSLTSGGAFTLNGGIAIKENMILGNGLNSISNSNTVGPIITTGGNVGIGRAPTKMLTLSGPGGDQNVGPNIEIFTSDQPNYPSYQQLNWSGDNISMLFDMYYDGVNFRASNSTPIYSIRKVVGQLEFNYGRSSAGSIVNVLPAMVIRSSGNVSILNANITTATIGTFLNTNAISTNISSGTINLSTGLTAGGAQITNANITTQTVGISRITTSIIATGSNNTVGNIFTTASGNVGIGTSNPDEKLHLTSKTSNAGPFVALDASANGGISYKIGSTLPANASGSNNLEFYDATSNAVRMVLNSAGNVGIGTIAPTALLDVNGSLRATNSIFTNISSGTLNLSSGLTSASAQITNVNITTQTVGTSRITNSIIATGNNTIGSIITTGGNVGIGLSNPSSLLHMYGFEPTLRIQENTGTTSSNSGVIELLQSNSTGYRMRYDGLSDRLVFESLGAGATQGNIISFKNDLRVESTFGTSVIVDSPYATQCLFEFYRDGVRKGAWYRPSNSDDIRFYSDLVGRDIIAFGSTGNIGMGTASPTSALQVVSTASTTSTLIVGNFARTAWNTAQINVVSNGTTGSGIAIERNTVDTALIANTGNLVLGHQNGAVTFNSGAYDPTSALGTERMRIQANGNVGIGDSNPSIKLDVNGDIGIKITSAPWDHIYLTHDLSRAIIRAGGAESGLSFDVNSATTGTYGTVNYTRVMTLLSSGNVGIGTTTPTAILDVNGSSIIRGIVTLTNTTQSNDVSTGSLLIAGGVAISKNLNVLGDTILTGNLTVQGTTTTIQTTNTVLNDNIFLLNSGPSGSKDSGFVIQRYQSDNNSGTGDVVTDTTYESNVLPSQTGMSSTQIKLSNSANSTDNYYVGWWVKVVGGFSNNQVRKITGYVGTTRVATISSAWNSQNPTVNDTVYLYNKPYIGLVYNEVNDRFEFTSVASEPSSSITSTDTIPLYAKSITLNSTSQATGVGTGGTLTVLGGSSISKDLYVGGTITSSSDIRLKDNIRDLKTSDDEKMIDKIELIRSIRYKYKDKSIDDKEHLGFIAQDFEDVFPELIRKNGSDGMYTLDYSKVTVILLDCIKELKQEIKNLKDSLNQQ
jgi:hypothetical protein